MSVGYLMDSLMNATTHSTTDRAGPRRDARELPARQHYPAQDITNRHRPERAHNPKVRGSATSVGLPRRANRTRMSSLCPTVVVGLPGTLGSVKTRAYQFFLGVCGLSGTSRNLPEPRNGACYVRCTNSATTPNGLAWRPRSPSCAAPGRSRPRLGRPTGTNSAAAATSERVRALAIRDRSDAEPPAPEFKCGALA